MLNVGYILVNLSPLILQNIDETLETVNSYYAYMILRSIQEYNAPNRFYMRLKLQKMQKAAILGTKKKDFDPAKVPLFEVNGPNSDFSEVYLHILIDFGESKHSKQNLRFRSYKLSSTYKCAPIFTPEVLQQLKSNQLIK